MANDFLTEYLMKKLKDKYPEAQKEEQDPVTDVLNQYSPEMEEVQKSPMALAGSDYSEYMKTPVSTPSASYPSIPELKANVSKYLEAGLPTKWESEASRIERERVPANISEAKQVISRAPAKTASPSMKMKAPAAEQVSQQTDQPEEPITAVQGELPDFDKMSKGQILNWYLTEGKKKDAEILKKEKEKGTPWLAGSLGVLAGTIQGSQGREFDMKGLMARATKDSPELAMLKAQRKEFENVPEKMKLMENADPGASLTSAKSKFAQNEAKRLGLKVTGKETYNDIAPFLKDAQEKENIRLQARYREEAAAKGAKMSPQAAQKLVSIDTALGTVKELVGIHSKGGISGALYKGQNAPTIGGIISDLTEDSPTAHYNMVADKLSLDLSAAMSRGGAVNPSLAKEIKGKLLADPNSKQYKSGINSIVKRLLEQKEFLRQNPQYAEAGMGEQGGSEAGGM